MVVRPGGGAWPEANLEPADKPMAQPIKLISTDFDGTLHADGETPPVPHDLQLLIGKLQAEGARWVINTGRDLSSLMEGVARARLTVQPDYLVVVEREVYVRSGSRYEPCLSWNEGCRRSHERLFDRIRGDMPRLVDWVSRRFKATLYEDDFSPFCLIAKDNSDCDAIMDYLEEYGGTVPGLSVVRNDIYARFSHADYNKGTALGEIARQLGVGREETFAAGDHLNDLPMLSGEFARWVAAPDNAVESVKALVRAQSGYVSHQPWGHGVARALEHFLEQAAR